MAKRNNNVKRVRTVKEMVRKGIIYDDGWKEYGWMEFKRKVYNRPPNERPLEDRVDYWFDDDELRELDFDH